MRRADPRQMGRWLARREREGWSWVELAGRSGQPVWRLRYWQRRLRGAEQRPRGPRFLPVTVGEPAGRPGSIAITTPIAKSGQLWVTESQSVPPPEFSRSKVRSMLCPAVAISPPVEMRIRWKA